MSHHSLPLLALCVLVSCVAPSGTVDAEGRRAPLLRNLGTLHRPVTTQSPEAQTFFDQGLRLTYAFNHAESLRAFAEAQRLDPGCAMAFWGEALALGPNINAPMEADAAPKAFAAAQAAAARAKGCTDVERALIDAMARRYSDLPDADRAELDRAYAGAMRQLATRFPDDPDVGTLAVAAFMETRPWDYWSNDGEPRPGTLDHVALIEDVIRRHPEHPGALHYDIHLVEASREPARGEAAADRLQHAMPGAGHMVHMPSHIYMRVGRYADASESNVRAIAADEDYLAQCRQQGLYPAMYYPHNVHFLWSAATMQGRSALAIETARKVQAKGAGCCAPSSLGVEDFASTPLFALARFGKWEEILREPKPPESSRFHTAMWHHARGVALAALARADDAAAELAALDVLAKDESLAKQEINFVEAAQPLAIARNLVAARIAESQGRFGDSAALLAEAVQVQDGLRYMEPPTWHYPVRQSLGACLLRAGKPADAERVYRDDLAGWPDNGWSLFGLRESLKAQGRDDDARAVDARFQKAWSKADVALKASAF